MKNIKRYNSKKDAIGKSENTPFVGKVKDNSLIRYALSENYGSKVETIEDRQYDYFKFLPGEVTEETPNFVGKNGGILAKYNFNDISRVICGSSMYDNLNKLYVDGEEFNIDDLIITTPDEMFVSFWSMDNVIDGWEWHLSTREPGKDKYINNTIWYAYSFKDEYVEYIKEDLSTYNNGDELYNIQKYRIDENDSIEDLGWSEKIIIETEFSKKVGFTVINDGTTYTGIKLNNYYNETLSGITYYAYEVSDGDGETFSAYTDTDLTQVEFGTKIVINSYDINDGEINSSSPVVVTPNIIDTFDGNASGSKEGSGDTSHYIALPQSYSGIHEVEFVCELDAKERLSLAGQGIFDYCHNLIELTIPSYVNEMDSNSCFFASHLETIIVNSPSLLSYDIDIYNKENFACYFNYQHISEYYFNTNLKKIVYGPSCDCENLHGYSRMNIMNLSEIHFYTNDTPYSTFYTYNQDIYVGDKIYLSSSVSGITNYSFGRSNISALNSDKGSGIIIIPSGVTFIGESAFQACENIKKVILPNTLKTMGAGAFRDCENLSWVYYKGTMNECRNNIIFYSSWANHTQVNFIECTNGTVDISDLSGGDA